MKTTNYSLRLDPAIKEKAEATFANFGLNLSDAFTVFLHAAIRCGGCEKASRGGGAGRWPADGRPDTDTTGALETAVTTAYRGP